MTFEGYIHVVDIHASRLQMAFEDAKNLLPITRETFINLSKEEIYIFELLTSRFSKMQDDIGSKIFSVILKIAAKESVAFIDNLNALEALNIIPSSDWWQDLRQLKNEITHDYEDEYDELTKHTNELMGRVQQLLEYWQSLKPILEELKSKLPRE